MEHSPPQPPAETPTHARPPVARPSVIQRALQRVPSRRRPALYFETLSSVGTGALITIFSISLVVLQTILEADLIWQALLATMFFGSSLFSPLVTYVGSKIPMRLLVVVPNAVVACLLLGTLVPSGGAALFTLVVGFSFIVRVFPRVAEMNMYRVFYPPTHRGAAVGLTRAVSALSGLSMTLLFWCILYYYPPGYPALYLLVAVLLGSAAWFYSHIPVKKRDMFFRDERLSPWKAFRGGLKAFTSDKRFMQYQTGFAVAGVANHIGLVFIPKVLDEHVGATRPEVGFITAVLPTFMVIASASVWGRFLDKRDPMLGRGIFNMLQLAAFLCYALGGFTRQLWPFMIGTALHGVSNGGGMINWLTGSMYFARSDQVSLYNGIHVCLTGVRGMIGPALGFLLFIDHAEVGTSQITGVGLGWKVFLVSAALSLAGGLYMFYLHKTDQGPRETESA